MKFSSQFFVLIAFGLGLSALADTPEKGYVDLVKKVGPGVVNISTFARPKIPQGGMYGNDMARRFFEEFFGGRMPPELQGPDDEQEGPKRPAPRKGKSQPLALGTGFVIDASEGLILTNFHVINGSEEVKIQFVEDDDELVPADIIGRDPELDVALLKVKTKKKLTAIPLGDSEKSEVGELLIAIGNPLGYGHTVSHGILSAKGRKNPEFRLGRYLQTDASINPGNSGGPLVNMKGEVIGINNAIDARGQGIGFAIPINLVKSAIPDLKAKGSVSRGYLGVSAIDLTPEIAEQLKIPSGQKGVLVADIGRDTPAEKAGIKPYDLITMINNQKVLDAQDLTAKITSVPVGGTADIKFSRKGKEMLVRATISERPTGQVAKGRGGPRHPEPKVESSVTFEDFGFSVQEVGEREGASLNIPPPAFRNGKVLAVTEIENGKSAEGAGLNVGDVLMDVSGKPVKSASEVAKAFKAVTGKSILLRVKRFNPQGGEFVSVVVLTR